MSTSSEASALPAATILLLRDHDGALEVLLAQRHSQLAFHGGAWVFPGGKIEPADRRDGADDEAAARVAAEREAQEEVGLGACPPLIRVSHWTTPVDTPKRFATWFFAARAVDGTVRVDGGEIERHRWMGPAAALEAQARRELELPPATFVTLLRLRDFGDVAGALAGLGAAPFEHFLPRTHKLPGGACSLYQADASYSDGVLDRPGPRHRLWMLDSGWRYERSP
jgi:8-oxo-dGTP pyrophosphatase MutT (NUDIX family)